MAPDPKCAAIDAAMKKQGLNYAQLASKTGSPESRIIEICTGSTPPSESEFKALAAALGITDNVPHSGVHTTT